MATNRWKRVKWTEAGQVSQLLGWAAEPEADAAMIPELYFDRLRTAGRLQDAVFFLGQALPRRESVSWSARSVRDIVAGSQAPRPDVEALRATLLWTQDPSEARRRAAFEASERAADDSAARLTALAAFFSGGSIAPADCPPVLAPREAAGRFAAGAVVVAAMRSADPTAALNGALEAGDAIAASGLEGDEA